MRNPSRLRRAAALPGFVFAALWSVAAHLPAVEATPTPPGEKARRAPIEAGMPLADALLRLQRDGLPILFSSLLVPSELTVRSAPAEGDPRVMLEALLAPHGLTVVEGEGGTLLVVSAARAAESASLQGSVRSRPDGLALAGVKITLLESGASVFTDDGGRFSFAALTPGRWTLRAQHPRYVVEQLEAVELAAGESVERSLLLQPAPFAGEEITVQPSRVSLLGDAPAAPFSLGRDEIRTLPHMGDDVIRALDLLPGTASNDITAQIRVRGGRRDELLVLLDGQELYDAYHLRDFDSALSLVPATELGALDLATGTFPPRYGDRMGGVLDMVTAAPGSPRRYLLQASLLALQAEGSGQTYPGLGWMVSARRGGADLASAFFDRPENPTFWDLLARLDGRPSDRHYWKLNALASTDRLDYAEVTGDEITAQDTRYDTSYFWLSHQAIVSARLFVDSALSRTGITRDRRGVENEDEKDVEVLDRRDLDVLALSQSWNLSLGPTHGIEAGFELRRFSADYDYRSDREPASPLAAIRNAPRDGPFAFRGELVDDYVGFHVVDRWRPSPHLTADIGARFDRHQLSGDSDWSPRIELAWHPSDSFVARAGWGLFHQSQRAYELMVEDADVRIYRGELTNQWVLSGERRFRNARPGAPATFRLEAYARRLVDPRPRYENLFEPFAPFPETAIDRYRFEPSSGRTRGLELFVEGRPHRIYRWWVNYAWSRSEDRIAGTTIPRLGDQRHALNATLATRLGSRWELALAFRYHSGWPTTPIALDERPDAGDQESELVPVLGEIDSERLPTYHRLDLRLSRRCSLRHGALLLYLDVQNAYDRANVAGYDLAIDEAAGEIVANEEPWPAFFASFGVTWEF